MYSFSASVSVSLISIQPDHHVYLGVKHRDPYEAFRVYSLDLCAATHQLLASQRPIIRTKPTVLSTKARLCSEARSTDCQNTLAHVCLFFAQSGEGCFIQNSETNPHRLWRKRWCLFGSCNGEALLSCQSLSWGQPEGGEAKQSQGLLNIQHHMKGNTNPLN